ncbi:MAG: hypothetical protein ACYDBQ_10530 [Thermoplasmatota archaeon]
MRWAWCAILVVAGCTAPPALQTSAPTMAALPVVVRVAPHLEVGASMTVRANLTANGPWENVSEILHLNHTLHLERVDLLAAPDGNTYLPDLVVLQPVARAAEPCAAVAPGPSWAGLAGGAPSALVANYSAGWYVLVVESRHSGGVDLTFNATQPVAPKRGPPAHAVVVAADDSGYYPQVQPSDLSLEASHNGSWLAFALHAVLPYGEVVTSGDVDGGRDERLTLNGACAEFHASSGGTDVARQAPDTQVVAATGTESSLRAEGTFSPRLGYQAPGAVSVLVLVVVPYPTPAPNDGTV